MSKRDEEYKAGKARFGEWYDCTVALAKVPKLKLPARIKRIYTNERKVKMAVVWMQHGICPCAECDHTGELMHKCEDGNCQCCSNLCT